MPFLPPNQQFQSTEGNIILKLLLHYTCLAASFPGQPGYAGTKKSKISLGLNEARDNGVWDGSGISRTICKQSAPCSSQITTPTVQHLIA